MPHISSLKSKLTTRPSTATDSQLRKLITNNNDNSRNSVSVSIDNNDDNNNNIQHAWEDNHQEKIIPISIKSGKKKKESPYNHTSKSLSTSRLRTTDSFLPSEINSSSSSRPSVVANQNLERNSLDHGIDFFKYLPEGANLPICLHHIADTFIRKVLPWQVNCKQYNSYLTISSY